MVSEILMSTKSTLDQALCEKSTKMHWYDYNNTIPLLNIVKSRIFHLVYNFKKIKFNTISSASQPAIRPSSISAMAPDFSYKKRNHV